MLEEKVMMIRNSYDEKNIYEDLLLTLRDIKNNCKKVKEKLSALAFDLSARGEAMTEISDEVYLNQKRLTDITIDLSNKKNLVDNVW